MRLCLLCSAGLCRCSSARHLSGCGAYIASVNYYFGDKERLYAETVKYACEKSAAKFPMPEWPEKMPASERLRHFISTFVNRMMDPESKPWQTQVIMRELAQPTSACQEWIREYVQPMADKLRAILMELTGEPASNDKVYQIGFSIVGQCLFYRQNRPIGNRSWVRTVSGPDDREHRSTHLPIHRSSAWPATTAAAKDTQSCPVP